MAKKISVFPKTADNPEIALEFTGRGPGEETPYYQGLIHAKIGRKWTRVGAFYNDGRGGMTCVDSTSEHGAAIRDHLTNAASEAFSAHSLKPVWFEPEGEVIGWAEMIGYDLKCSSTDFSLQDYIAVMWCKPSDFDREPKTATQTTAFQTAKKKAQTLVAHRYATKDKTAVFIGDHVLVFSTRNRSVVEAEMAKRGGEYTILV